MRRGAWLGAVLAVGMAGCGEPPIDTGDAGPIEERPEVCFPSCRLGEVCTRDNRCVVPTSPFRDAGFSRDLGRD